MKALVADSSAKIIYVKAAVAAVRVLVVSPNMADPMRAERGREDMVGGEMSSDYCRSGAPRAVYLHTAPGQYLPRAAEHIYISTQDGDTSPARASRLPRIVMVS